MAGAKSSESLSPGDPLPLGEGSPLALEMREHVLELHHVGIFVMQVEQIDLVREIAAAGAPGRRRDGQPVPRRRIMGKI